MSGDPRTTDPLTPTDVRRLLDQHGLAPRRSDGQNFVVDPNTVRKIVRDAGVTGRDHVLEFGPGLGSLTVALAEVAAYVTAIEIDAGFVEVLGRSLGHRDDVHIVHGDALATDLTDLIESSGHGPARLVANLPYNVATPMVFHALACPLVTDAFAMVQREVGERWGARPEDGAYSGVSAKLALLVEVEVVADVPRTVFLPVPNVDSVTVRLVRRTDAVEPERYAEIAGVIDAAFATRRKTIRNALGRVHDRDELDRAFADADVDPGARAEELAPADFRRLASALVGDGRP